MSSPARIDVLVYGASGFTGEFIAARIAWHVSAGRLTSYALCGRDASRLAAVASRLASAGLPAPAALLLADARDEAALRAAIAADARQACGLIANAPLTGAPRRATRM